MEHTTDLIISDQPIGMNLETCIAGWIQEKRDLSESSDTELAYITTLFQFRALLQSAQRDLDADPREVAPAAQGWAGHSTHPGKSVAAGTYNQRLAILSSFYKYAIRHEVLHYNPIERVMRRKQGRKDAARPIPTSRVKEGFAHIDRTVAEGRRDYTLLVIALATGRRADELAGLRYGDIAWHGETSTLTWRRCKGNEQLVNILPERTTTILRDYLYAVYGAEIGTLAPDAAVWPSYSHHNTGQAIGYKTVSRICEKYLGTSKVHATRHTWAVTMHKQGASLSEIGRGLGHKNLKTTSDYMQEQLGYENPYAHALEDAYGIEEEGLHGAG